MNGGSTAGLGGFVSFNDGGLIVDSYSTDTSRAVAPDSSRTTAAERTYSDPFHRHGHGQLLGRTASGTGCGYGTGETTAQLQNALPGTFSSSLWGGGNSEYPYLKSFIQTAYRSSAERPTPISPWPARPVRRSRSTRTVSGSRRRLAKTLTIMRRFRGHDLDIGHAGSRLRRQWRGRADGDRRLFVRFQYPRLERSDRQDVGHDAIAGHRDAARGAEPSVDLHRGGRQRSGHRGGQRDDQQRRIHRHGTALHHRPGRERQSLCHATTAHGSP